MKILIAEDSLVSRTLLESALRKWGYEVVSVANGIEALAALQSEDAPSLAILDVQMPGIDGTEVCQRLRETPRLTPPYIILLTANTDKAATIAGLESGADDYVTKPFDYGELRARVHVGVRMAELQGSLARHIRVLEDTSSQLERNSATLRQERIFLRTLIDSIPDSIYVKDMACRKLIANLAEVRISGCESEAELLGKDDFALHPKELAAKFFADDQMVLQTGQPLVNREEYVLGEQGEKRWLLTTKLPLHDENGQVIGLIGLGRDITERKGLENQLLQAQKLESVGQLAAGISHEINTPTQYVSDNTRFLRDAFQDLRKVHEKYSQLAEACRNGTPTADLLAEVDALAKEADVAYLTLEIPKAVEQALEGTERISKIVQSMKDFAHPGTAVMLPCDLNKAIDSTITIACGEWKYVADMVTDFDTTLPLVPCLQGEFNQVVLNMIINASHAIGDAIRGGLAGKGTITISTRRAGAWAEIRVGDTGTGIPEGNRGRIFDPFFTTKQVGKGTGQGLSISHNVVVEKHGGTITFETTEGQGTTFIIRLPLHEIASTPDGLKEAA